MRHVALLAAFLLVVPAGVAGAGVGIAAGVDTDTDTAAVGSSVPAPASGSDAVAVPTAVRFTSGRSARPTPAFGGPPVAPQLSDGTVHTNFTIALRADGSARWTVASRFPLADETDREAFRAFADSFVANETDGGPSVDVFRNAASAASRATGREMAIVRVNRSATLANDSGVLRLRFTWRNFLPDTGSEELRLGDAFATPGNGTWFPSLAAGQRLVIVPPEGYEAVDISGAFDYSVRNRRIIAEGPQSFEQGDIAVVYRGETPTETPERDSSVGLVVGGAVVGFLVVVVLLLYRRGSGAGGGAGGGVAPSGDAPAGTDAGGAEADPTDGTTSTGNGDATATGAGGAAGDAADGDDADADEDEDEEDLELLSDEERVERLLERNGGRMRQAAIVSETGWSDAKVSQLLSRMAEEGRVEKLRLGRENLISLPDGSEDGEGDGADDAT